MYKDNYCSGHWRENRDAVIGRRTLDPGTKTWLHVKMAVHYDNEFSAAQ